MKRTLALILTLVLLLPAALAMAAEKPVINPEFNKDEMLNIHGQMTKLGDIDKTLGDTTLGYFVVMPDYLMSKEPDHQFPFDWSPASTGFYYVPNAMKEDNYRLNTATVDNISEEDYFALIAKVEDAMIPVFSILRVNPDKYYSNEIEQQHKEDFQHLDHFLDNGEDKIFIVYNTNFDKFDLTDEEKTRLQEVVEEAIKVTKEGIMVFPPVDPYEGVAEEEVLLDGGAEGFSSEDMNGNAFDAVAEFAKYDLTIVNVWFTGCNPCIAEMPSLQALKDALPENVNLISVCLDGEEEHELAAAILADAGVSFTTLKGDKMGEGVLKHLQATPTNFFLDSQGKQVGLAVVGAMASLNDFVEGSMELILTRLEMLGK